MLSSPVEIQTDSLPSFVFGYPGHSKGGPQVTYIAVDLWPESVKIAKDWTMATVQLTPWQIAEVSNLVAHYTSA